MSVQAPEGILFVISAPSGTGKSTVSRRLIERVPNLVFSVSYTTRPRRDREKDGRDYHFVERDRFDAMVRDGELLEWADVFEHRYGTGLEATRKQLERSCCLLLDIDVQGARQVRESQIPGISVMLLPPDYATLEKRLRRRGSEPEAELDLRLARARKEAEDYRYFDFTVINEDVETAVRELESIVRAERSRSGRCDHRVKQILATFPHEGEVVKER